MLALGLTDGLTDELGLWLALGLTDGLTDALGDWLEDGLMLALGDCDALTDELGLVLALGDTDAEALTPSPCMSSNLLMIHGGVPVADMSIPRMFGE